MTTNEKKILDHKTDVQDAESVEISQLGAVADSQHLWIDFVSNSWKVNSLKNLGFTDHWLLGRMIGCADEVQS